MFGFIKKMFIGLLIVCTIVSFSRSLACNSKEPIKCVLSNIVIRNNKIASKHGHIVDIFA